MQGLNIVLMLCEGSLNRYGFVQWHQLFLVYWLLCYLLFCWINFSVTHKFVYNFLDVHNPHALLGESMALFLALCGFQLGTVWTTWLKIDTQTLKLGAAGAVDTSEHTRLNAAGDSPYRGVDA